MAKTAFIFRPGVIALILSLQFIPLLLLPASSYGPTTQEWWLPVLLSFLALIAVIELVVRRSSAAWPWLLIAFAQGFNIISRLMLIWPHATETVNGAMVMNWTYVLMTLAAFAMSAFYLWYVEQPEVRMGLARRPRQPARA
jgi:hypothetical protein